MVIDRGEPVSLGSGVQISKLAGQLVCEVRVDVLPILKF
ncbi:MAG: hypothetical protein JWN70_5022, partial [Planctomycetaceae bacterium]|nr:hypothetical protein [Planctomycetaceae bacterium]